MLPWCVLGVLFTMEWHLPDGPSQVELPGGPLIIEWRESDNHIYMTGPADLVFGGDVQV